MKLQKRAAWMAVAAVVAAMAVGIGCTKKKEEEKPPEKTEKGYTDTEGRTKEGLGSAARPAGHVDRTKVQPRVAIATVPTAGPGPKVRIKTSMGDIVVQLNPAKAPISVKNFLGYVNQKTYDGTIFHRVIPHFMIQGGGFTPKFVKKPSNPPIKNEATNGLRHVRGTVAMARTMVIDSATNQFFINVKDNMFLNHRGQTGRTYGYTVFGKVVQGMDVVDKIRYVPTGAKGPFGKDCPQKDVIILSVRVVPSAGSLPSGGNTVKPPGKKPRTRPAARKTR